MTTPLQTAAQAFVTAVKLDRHDSEDWPEASRNALDGLRKALEAEQAQAVESITDCMMNLVDRLGHEASSVDARAWSHLMVYAPKQAVEPVAWIGDSPSKGNGRRLFWSESEAYAYADKYDPLYTHPAPPATDERDHVPDAGKMMGERAKVGDSRFESWYSELHQAGKGSKQIAREAYEAGLNEAQQVAVPAGYVLVPIEPTLEMIVVGRNTPCSAVEEDIDADYRAVYKAMLAAAQGAKK